LHKKITIHVKDDGIGIPQKIVGKSLNPSSPQNLQDKEQDWV